MPSASKTPRVSLVSGPDRRTNVRRALQLVAADVEAAVTGRELVMVKPNFVVCYRQLAATHVDAVRGVLDVIRPMVSGRLVIAEGAALGPTGMGYLLYGYRRLRKEYDVELVNLNHGPRRNVGIEGHSGSYGANPVVKRFRPQVAISELALEADCRISVAMPKTHDQVVATLGYKNMAMGAISGVTAKRRMHQGYPEINMSLARLAPLVRPHLTVIDGMRGMEGRGPTKGTAVDMGVALAGSDFVAVDCATASLMGVDARDMGYLWQCHEAGLGEARLDRIAVVGEAIADHIHAFRMHPDFERQVAHLRRGH